jgi:hypothetical protein
VGGIPAECNLSLWREHQAGKILLGTSLAQCDRLFGLVVRVPGYRSRSWVRFPALPDSVRSSRSGTESNQPREYN